MRPKSVTVSGSSWRSSSTSRSSAGSSLHCFATNERGSSVCRAEKYNRSISSHRSRCTVSRAFLASQTPRAYQCSGPSQVLAWTRPGAAHTASVGPTVRIQSTCHSIIRAAKSLLILAGAAAVFVVTVHAQSPGVAPSEANHFIETPKGWVHPRTAWGDPDLTGIWPIAHGLNLVRNCPRAGGPGRGGPVGRAASTTRPRRRPRRAIRTTLPVFQTEEAYKAEVDRALGIRKTGDGATQALAKAISAGRCRAA